MKSNKLYIVLKKKKTSHLQKTKDAKKKKKKEKKNKSNAMLDNLKCLMWAKGFQRRKTDDEAVGAGPPINFLNTGFQKIQSPSLSQQLFLLVFLKTNQFTNVFFFVFFNAENNWTNARNLRLFFWMSAFFFFILNQWYACSNNFYIRSWKATCFWWIVTLGCI